MERDKGSGSQADRRAHKFEGRLRRSAEVGAGILLLACVVYAASVGSNAEEGWEIFGVAVTVSAAAAAAGGLLGFLFGIPKTLQSDAPSSDGSTRYLGNTNLEQISDWLTKIIVGLGLVQLGRALPALARLGESLGPMLGDVSSSPGFGLSLCIYSAVVAFVVVYLWTRVDLRREMMIADSSIETSVQRAVEMTVQPVVQDTVDEAVKETVDAAVRTTAEVAQQTAVAVVDQQSQRDALVLSLVDRQLTGHNPPAQSELDEALSGASRLALTQTYQRAEWQRRATWQSERAEDTDALERTVPVFRALVANDRERRFHRHFADLGYALKDGRQPDYAAARDMLNQAIEIRDRLGIGNFALYEWNRALCSIRLDQRFSSDEPSDEATRNAILADLKRAATGLTRTMFQASDSAEPDAAKDAVAHWLELNGLTLADLLSA